MDETKELLTAIMGRLQEMGAEMKGLADKVEHNGAKLDGLTVRVGDLTDRVDGLSAEVQGLKAEVQDLKEDLADFRTETGESLAKIQYRLDYFAQKYVEHDQEIYLLKRKQA